MPLSPPLAAPLTGADPVAAQAARRGLWLGVAGMLMFAVAFIATWLFSTLAQMRSGIDPRRWLLIAFLGIVFGVYFTWFWSRGQTLAMKTWNIRAVDRDGPGVNK